MIDWKSIKELHASKSLEKIIGNWYGLDVLYVDEQGRVQFVQDADYLRLKNILLSYFIFDHLNA